MNWQNVNLNSASEADSNLLDPYSFDTLLLEIHCNLPIIDREKVRAQAMESIKIKYQTAIDILNANLDNITTFAQKERAKP